MLKLGNLTLARVTKGAERSNKGGGTLKNKEVFKAQLGGNSQVGRAAGIHQSGSLQDQNEGGK